ncbi:MAG: PEP-CTERM sorting domain-containing protein [Akkermansiaceae bacterium]|nr:PEP-CTERM sorting domain-containing protein [Akkermansiaceae bacterium]
MSLCFVAPLHAAMVSVTPAQFGTFSLDVDSDGTADLSNLASQVGGLSYAVRVDGMAAGSYVTFPDTTFAGFESRSFSDLSALSLDSLFSGNFTAPALINREFDNIPGSGFATSAAPVHAWWAYGTSGSGNAPLHLLGFVADFTDYFTSGGTAAVDIYYHDYGSFSAGQNAGTVTLATTGVPEPASSALFLSALATATLIRRRHA